MRNRLHDRYWANKRLTLTKEEQESAKLSDDATGDSSNSVDIVDNKIFFYSDVDREHILSLNKALIDVDDQIVTGCGRWAATSLSPIHLHINSNGGSIFACCAAIDYIRNTKAPTHTIIDGCAASAATIMSVVGKKRFINKNAFMLIHQLSGMCWGTYEQLKDDAVNNDRLMEFIRSIYEKHTEIPKKKLDEMLKHDLWFDAKTCLEYNLVDEILE